jgi:hypothetical protein
MKLKTLFFLLCILFPVLSSRAQESSADKKEQVKEEIRRLFVELNRAFEKRDRQALERIYAEEFVWVHGSGFVDDRATHINDAFSIEVRLPLEIPKLENLYVYGDTAINKHTFAPDAGRGALYATSIFVKRDGRWQMVHAQGTLLQPERETIRVDSKILDAYAGKYENDAKESLTITREGDALILAVRRPGIPKRKLNSATETQFFDKLGSEVSFSKGEGEKITLLTIRLNGRESRWRKIE